MTRIAQTGRQVRPADDPAAAAATLPTLSFSVPRRGKPPQHLADLDVDARSAVLAEMGHPGYRAKQVSTHYFTHLVRDPEAMTDLPAAVRDDLAATLLPDLLTEVRRMEADGGATVKTLWSLFDDVKVESVLMGYKDRATLCVSSQAGCGMACPFCATGQMGMTRNLSTAEIIEQVRHAALACRNGELARAPRRLSNIVFMGMGEPLANYKAVIGAVRRLVEPSPSGFGMSARNVTVSTVGLVPAIDKLTKEGIPVTLALSLHAPDDELRSELVPINTRWKVGETLDAARRYFEATGRRVSIEYALIKDMNDHAWRADLLGEELNRRGRGWVHVNPIPLNPTPGSIWTASEKHVEDEFVTRLRAAGIPTTVRDTRGSDIDGACGQLAIQS
ncbi:23S rRNA (adenine(2503)-C(2))-methyltransferase RlmN [Pseudactinotalea suaedae]|jgi:23S rRNA (adenine2503-C2)-methyltransferase|uniref:23S rRNA (adenine(2503)-C(2))-methyltransferase RlmN n=1 Tax=Pseudactinotalea suaedae TaxID=1524924 RepID=UPI0012E23A57|nr:23S rRNA (adenine(2503)-C(2))-methyltransferase RlmN [Pseudactinotalea suaedae]